MPVTSTQFHLNGLVFHYDANAGQKTGAFLDQRTNYAAARDWALNGSGEAERRPRPRRLLLPGRFRLASCPGLPAGHGHRRLARLAGSGRAQPRGQSLATDAAEVDWVEADAFEILREWSDAGESFDAIVLDPPAFAKTKRAVEGALRGYKELNLRALQMVRRGGLLVTCSCSHHVGWADLEAAVASAAADASRRVRLLERRGAAPDHPVVLNLPETEYLKCLVLEVE